MKRIFIILLSVTCLWSVGRLMGASDNRHYMDDSYYWPMMDSAVIAEPIYDKNARELIFLEDTTQSSDTVRMRIVERTTAN